MEIIWFNKIVSRGNLTIQHERWRMIRPLISLKRTKQWAVYEAFFLSSTSVASSPGTFGMICHPLYLKPSYYHNIVTYLG